LKNRRSIRLLSVFAIALCIGSGTGCKSPGKGSAGEGMIEYQVNPVNANSAFAAMAPTSMTLKYKNDRLIAEMSTGLSAVEIKFISDNKKGKFTQCVKILNQKYLCSFNATSMNSLFKDTPKYDVKKVDEFKTIAGLNCQKAEIYEKGTNKHLFDVFFTDEFKFTKPNWWNEFSGIDGMLMEYQMKRYNMDLHFIARKITSVAIDSTVFIPKGNYETISQNELNSYFNAFK
jgi:hypothetical protein